MCKWYCLSEGPSTNLKCLNCGARYCAACLHGEFPGKMESLIKCGKCGKKPQVKPNSERSSWADVPAVKTPVPPASAVRVNRTSSQEAGDVFLSNLRAGTPPVRTPIAGRRASPAARNSSGSLPETNTLQYVFGTFCNFGDHATALDGAKFVKLCKDTGLTPSKLSTVDAELIFSKSIPHGERKMNLGQFEGAVRMIAAKVYPQDSAAAAYSRIMQQFAASPRPRATGTAAHTGGIFDKLTDASLYTGAHKHRFDENGRGRGLAGRESPAKGPGYIPLRV